jgi:hypothetical protein
MVVEYGGFNSCLLIDNLSVCQELEQFDVCFLPPKISRTIYEKFEFSPF